MKNLLTTLVLFITTLSYAQQLTKDTVYLEWRGDKFFEITESVLDNGQRQLNERPIGDTIQTIQYYVENTENAFNGLAEAARIMIQKNAIIQNVNKVNTILSRSFNTDLMTISSNVVSETFKGDYKFKLPDAELIDAKIDENLNLVYSDNSVKIIPIGYNYIQLNVGDKVYELYRLGDGQYASIDVQTVLLKNK